MYGMAGLAFAFRHGERPDMMLIIQPAAGMREQHAHWSYLRGQQPGDRAGTGDPDK